MKRELLVILGLDFLAACKVVDTDIIFSTHSPVPTNFERINIPNATILYYDISGSNENELRDQLDTLGPVGYDGYKGDSTTYYYISWNWDGYGSSLCNLSSATISYTI